MLIFLHSFGRTGGNAGPFVCPRAGWAADEKDGKRLPANCRQPDFLLWNFSKSETVLWKVTEQRKHI